MKLKWALIDDLRDIYCDFVARNGHDGLTMMKEHFDEIGTLCLDHDLGDAHELSGYDVLKALLAEELLPDIVILVTDNPIGRENMARELVANGYKRSPNGKRFRKLREGEEETC